MLEVIKTAPSNVNVLSDVVAQISDYYRHHNEASQALADWMTYSFCPQTIFAIINQVLSNSELLAQIAARSYHHGNGFLKVVLAAQDGWKLRLHVWFANTPCEENIHDHRWGFASTVLCGQLLSETFVDDIDGDITGTEYLYHARQNQDESQKHIQGRFCLRSLGQQCRGVGESYFLPTSVLHRICDYSNKNIVATMMCSAPTQQGTNRLLVSDDRQGIDPNVEQNPLSSHELACLLGRFLCAYAATQWPLAA
ncbi:MAG: hypothetical protein KBF23_00515 [Agitococcus sp.]|nr:hypothetical protein [Agitococcus sp.]